jgi:hypothetical protein
MARKGLGPKGMLGFLFVVDPRATTTTALIRPSIDPSP